MSIVPSLLTLCHFILVQVLLDVFIAAVLQDREDPLLEQAADFAVVGHSVLIEYDRLGAKLPV